MKEPLGRFISTQRIHGISTPRMDTVQEVLRAEWTKNIVSRHCAIKTVTLKQDGDDDEATSK